MTFGNRMTALTTALVFIGLKVSAGDWAEFRGPGGSGLSDETGLPTFWNSASNVTWRAEIPGKGWSSPIYVSNRVYLTTAIEGSKLSLRCLALDAQNGKILWDQEVFQKANAGPAHSKNSQASPTPVLDGQQIFVHFGHNGTAALDLNGKVLWRNESINYSPVHGGGGSPVLLGNAIIFNCDGAQDPFIIALNRSTGLQLWRTPRKTSASKTFSFSTPLTISVDNAPQVVSSGSGVVCAYDPNSGNEIWRVRYPEGYSVVPKPIFGHNQIYLSTGFDRPIVYAIKSGGKGDITETHVAWKIPKGAPTTPTPLLVGEELYFISDGGIASCVDARTGVVHWQERIGGNHSASPVYADGKIYFQNEKGVGAVIKPGKKFELLTKENNLGEPTLASYAIGNKALYIRTEKHLYKIAFSR